MALARISKAEEAVVEDAGKPESMVFVRGWSLDVASGEGLDGTRSVVEATDTDSARDSRMVAILVTVC